MTKIRQLKPTDIRKVQKLIEYIHPSAAANLFYESKFTLFPFDVLQNLLPINMRFLPESYVAVEGNEILGLIGLIPDGQQKTRWKINRFVLNANSYDVGKQLINYVVNKYGGAGVETFITTIDDNYTEAISLFKDSCGFRSCTHIQIWEKDINEPKQTSESLRLLRDLKVSDAKNLQELDQYTLFPQFRTSLVKNISDYKFGLKNQILNNFRGFKVKRLVLENPSKNLLEGYVMIMTKDNLHFFADILLSFAYQDYYEDILNYINRYVYFQSNKAKLYVYARNYYQSHKKLTETLENNHFNLCQGFQVLVKDYWKPAKVSSDEKRSPIIIFPDITSPACNIIKISDIKNNHRFL